MILNINQNFLIFSLPGSTEFSIFHQQDFGTSNGLPHTTKYAFIRPFEDGSSSIFIAAESAYEIDPLQCELNFSAANFVHCMPHSEYIEMIAEARQLCLSGLNKIVLSRSDEQHMNTLNWGKWLINSRRTFRDAFIYLLNTKEFGCWLGVTPETLVKKRGNMFSTMAYAGTRWGTDRFTTKELEEHESVLSTICSNLNNESLTISETREVAYGQIRHLKTDIAWESNQSAYKAAELLHPTPAVCGSPRSKAMDFILNHEQRSRQLYTGFIGVNSSEEKCDVFVNLRCMQLFRDRIRFYVGGGINAMSDEQNEWEETVRKMKALTHAMTIND